MSRADFEARTGDALASAHNDRIEITENGKTAYVLMSAEAYADLVGPPVPSALAALSPQEDLSGIDLLQFLPARRNED